MFFASNKPKPQAFLGRIIAWSKGGFLISAAFLFLMKGCSSYQPILKEQVLKDRGRFEFREPVSGLEGVVIGAPHGKTDRNSDRIALAISDRTGAGLVIGYGFKSKRLSVAQPIVRSGPDFFMPRGLVERGSVYREFRAILRKTAKAGLEIYMGIHRSSDKKVADRIEVATGGLAFDEARVLKEAYIKILDELTAGKEVPKLTMEIEPLDRISWRTSGVKHHGVLLIAEKGVHLRIPQMFSEPAEELYAEILSQWAERVIDLLRENPLGVPQVRVRLTDLGRFELVESRNRLSGVVIAAPHGSFDEHTAEVVKRLSHRTGLAAVIAKGFTPTDAGGWRINVNRPTEKIPHSEGREVHSDRAKEVYRIFRDLVFEASSGDLGLYVDVHQYGRGGHIEVATVGVSRDEARVIKKLYRAIRRQVLGERSDLADVDLLIEPLDEIEIGAWAAKAKGILSLAKRSLHIEIPQKALATAEGREKYTRILAALLQESVPLLVDH